MLFRLNAAVVPPREERMEKIGDPKPPKMGSVTPKAVKVPEVDDLLKQMGASETRRSLFDFFRGKCR